MSKLAEVLDKFKNRNVVDRSNITFPTRTQGSELAEVFETMLDPENVEALANITETEAWDLALIKATVDTDDVEDLREFLFHFSRAYLGFTVAVKSKRAEDLVKISQGAMGMEAELRMAEIKAQYGKKGQRDMNR